MGIRVEHTEIINCPLDKVWNYTTDTSHLMEWQPSVLSAYDEGEKGVGVRHHQTRKVIGRDLTSVFECVEYNPPHRVVMRVVSGPIPYDLTQTYETIPEGTKLTVVVEGEPNGFFAVAAPLVVNQIKHDFEADFARLKTILEAM